MGFFEGILWMEKHLKNVIKKLELVYESGKRHDLYILYIGDHRIGQFGISRESGEKWLPPYVYKQLGIPKELFEQVKGCTASRNEVVVYFRENNIL